MKPHGQINHWKAEADMLPMPTMEGERTISPGNVAFQVVALVRMDGTSLGWEVCTRDWMPVGISFRHTPFCE